MNVLELLIRRTKEDAIIIRNQNPYNFSEVSVLDSSPLVPPVKFVNALGKECETRNVLKGFDKELPRSTEQSVKGMRLTEIVRNKGVNSNRKNKGYSSIDYLVIIDRKVDLITPLCTTFTYEGLLDLFFGINHRTIDVPVEILAGDKSLTRTQLTEICSSKSLDKKKIDVSDSDILYSQIRHLHISEVGRYLYKKTHEISEIYKEKNKLQTFTEINKFVKKFTVCQTEHLSLTPHVNIAGVLSNLMNKPDMIEKLRLEDEIIQNALISGKGDTNVGNILNSLDCLIDKNLPVHEAYKFMCLLSIVNNGIPLKQFNRMKLSIMQAYGYNELRRLIMLEKIGILHSNQSTKSSFYQLNKCFNLLVQGIDMMKDISYACSGYAPLSIRLIELLFSLPKGWSSCSDSLNLLWGPALEVKQQPLVFNNTDENTLLETNDDAISANKCSKNEMKNVLVMFLGGVTYSEIATLEKLNEIDKGQRKYMILTTEMINCKQLFDGIDATLVRFYE